MLCKCSMDYNTTMLLQYKQIFKLILFSVRRRKLSFHLHSSKEEKVVWFNTAVYLLPTKKNNVVGSLECKQKWLSQLSFLIGTVSRSLICDMAWKILFTYSARKINNACHGTACSTAERNYFDSHFGHLLK